VLAVDPGHADAHYSLGFVLEKVGANLGGAAAHFRAAIAAYPQRNCCTAHSSLGIVLFKRGDLAGAEAAYRAAIAADPQHAPAQCNLAVILEDRGTGVTSPALRRCTCPPSPPILSTRERT
jgi:Flp pilus assembly protein TadD